VERASTTPSLPQRPPPPVSAPSRARQYLKWLAIAGALLVIVLGFLGLDRAFYLNVSCRLETKDNLFDRDFYTVTRPFWWACRYAFAHVIGAAALIAAIAVLHPRRWRAASAAAVAVLVAALVANGAQALIGRPRPNQADLAQRGLRADESHAGFPSGEAATALALATVLSRSWPRYRVAFYACGILTAASRLVNGAHYLSDVVAGALWGTICAAFLFDHADWLLERLRSAVKHTGQPPP
jgi:membrane-associated phospholipid phosphatase